MIRTLNRRVVVVAVMLVMVVAGGCRSLKSTPTQESPLSPIVPSPIIPTRPPKIDPELMVVIEKGRKAAPGDFQFDYSGRIRCTVDLDPNKIVVTSRWSEGPSIKKQPGGQLIARYEGEAVLGLDISNSVSAWMPLDNIEELAQEDVVLSIAPSRLVEHPKPITIDQ